MSKHVKKSFAYILSKSSYYLIVEIVVVVNGVKVAGVEVVLEFVVVVVVVVEVEVVVVVVVEVVVEVVVVVVDVVEVIEAFC